MLPPRGGFPLVEGRPVVMPSGTEISVATAFRFRRSRCR